MKIGKYHVSKGLVAAGCATVMTVTGVLTYNSLTKSSNQSRRDNIDYFVPENRQSVSREISSDDKWNSLGLNDKVYFLKTGYLDLPDGKKKEVCNFLKNEFSRRGYGESKSKIEKISDYIKFKVKDGNAGISKKDIFQNYKNLESFLLGGKNGKNN